MRARMVVLREEFYAVVDARLRVAARLTERAVLAMKEARLDLARTFLDMAKEEHDDLLAWMREANREEATK